MPSLKAQSISTTIRAWLNNPHHAWILHLFDQAINLISGTDILSLVPPHIGDGPFNIVVSPVEFTRYVTLADPIHLSSDEIQIGTLTIDLSSAVQWDPHPDWNYLRKHRSCLQQQASIIREVLRQHAPANSLARLIIDIPAPSSRLDTHFVNAARHHWQYICQAARELDQAACTAHVKKLVGLGPGLTPAGDDWLLGCALAAHLDLPSPAAAAILLNAIRETPTTRTNPLSANWLCAAVDGACSSLWHAVLACDDTYQTALQIVKQGHSSGADALAGYFTVLVMHNVHYISGW